MYVVWNISYTFSGSSSEKETKTTASIIFFFYSILYNFLKEKNLV